MSRRDDRPSKKSETAQRILAATRRMVQSDGLARLTIQSVADELDVTKQAVLYWFPSKNVLLQELLIEAIEEESSVLVAAVEPTANAAEAIEAFLRRGFAHFKANLSAFRLIYLTGQLERSVHDLLPPEVTAERIYPVTSRIYDALEAKFRSDPAFPADVEPRNFAVSLHMTLLGHVCGHGLMDAIDDQFKQTFEEMLDAMLGVLTHGLSSAVEG